jgi:hypothetical protein
LFVVLWKSSNLLLGAARKDERIGSNIIHLLFKKKMYTTMDIYIYIYIGC